MCLSHLSQRNRSNLSLQRVTVWKCTEITLTVQLSRGRPPQYHPNLNAPVLCRSQQRNLAMSVNKADVSVTYSFWGPIILDPMHF